MRNLSTTDLGMKHALDFIPCSDTNYWAVLDAGTALLVEIPAGAKYIIFEIPDKNYGVKWGDSSVEAQLPSSAGLTDLIDDYNPAMRSVPASATHLSIISAEAQSGMLSFYG